MHQSCCTANCPTSTTGAIAIPVDHTAEVTYTGGYGCHAKVEWICLISPVAGGGALHR